jgi:hypothetical protein
MLRTLVVSVEPLWPEVHGGRLRTARLAEALSRAGHQVTVAAPSQGERTAAPPGISTIDLGQWSAGTSAKLRASFSAGPRLGVLAVGSQARLLQRLAADFDVVVWAHSYLAAAAGPLAGPVGVIDVANVEMDRFRSMAANASFLARLPRRWEAVKALRWEPAAWRTADVCITLNAADAACVRTAVDGTATRVVLGANGVDSHPYVPSPVSPVVALVASYRYPPNVDAARWVLEQVWPKVASVVTDARLVLAGRDAAGAFVGSVAPGSNVEFVSDFDDPRAVHAAVSVVLAPVRFGGGTQLKVSEALSHHRVVVASPYSASATPPTAAGTGAVVVADTADEWSATVSRLLLDTEQRHHLERQLCRPGVVPTWDDTLGDAIAAIEVAKREHVGRTSGPAGDRGRSES